MEVININSKTSLYCKAMLYVAHEQYKEAYLIFKHLEDYKKSSLFADICLQEFSPYANVQVNGIIKFGSYIQELDQKEPIEWIVLDKQEDKMLVVSKKILDCRKYHNKYEKINWEYSDIRKWLNNDFLNNAFSSEEQTQILQSKIINESNPTYKSNSGNKTFDKVFLLSINEANRYFKDEKARRAKGSNSAKNHNLWIDIYGNGFYWLRSSDDRQYSAVIDLRGDVSDFGHFVGNDRYGIRPALWIKFES